MPEQCPRALGFPWEDLQKAQTNRPNGGDRAAMIVLGGGGPSWMRLLVYPELLAAGCNAWLFGARSVTTPNKGQAKRKDAAAILSLIVV